MVRVDSPVQASGQGGALDRGIVTRISRINRCRRFQGNAKGRDLVVGDLHGHRVLFERELERLGFDPKMDRVFSVGDLVNRGPDSLGTLSLIEEPWFHPVLGNHELMMLNFLGYYSSRVHCRRSYPAGGGEWIGDAIAKHPKRVRRLADRVASLSLAIHVDADVAFNVMHGDLALFGSRQTSLFDQKVLCVHEADRSTSSRINFQEAVGSTLFSLTFADLPACVSETPFGDLHLTYVGHTPVREVVVHNSYIYIDQGVCPRRAGYRPPTIVNHAQFSTWLRGVATAWRPAPANGRFAPGNRSSADKVASALF